MSNCILCNTKLGFTNKPTFGQGKLKDGNEICFPCFKNNGGTISKFKEMTTIELKEFISNRNQLKEDDNKRLNEIKQQIQDLKLSNLSSFFGRKEINELPSILFDNENVIDIVQGTYEKRIGILVATESRVIFIDKGIFNLKVEDFPYDKITSIQFETGFVMGKLIILASGNKAQIEDVVKDRVKPFADNVRTRISELGKKENSQTVIVNQQIDIAEQLTKLSGLRDNGILTEEEFQTQKQKLLNM